MNASFSDFCKEAKPLDKVLKKAYTKARKRERDVSENFVVQRPSQVNEHSVALASIQFSLCNALEVVFL